jgi:hypothetical protein
LSPFWQVLKNAGEPSRSSMLLIPLSRLPLSAPARQAQLRDYFCDKDAKATQTENGWELSLFWPEGAERHVDPNLEEGLVWWGDGVMRSTMAYARRRSGRILTSLYDTWTLHSWSEWAARAHPSDQENIVILHVDDHRDLAAPRLFFENDIFRDALSGAQVELTDPDAIRNAILSGALGMGSFLTLFLHRYRNAEVRHLCQPPKVTATIDHVIEPSFDSDTLIQPGALRPAIRLVPQPGKIIGPGHYRITPHTEDWLDNLGSGPILLHIDMDYFNNRYDGDTDWTEHPEPFNPSFEQAAMKIDEMCSALTGSSLGHRIADVVISYSPGFFPAEFWRDADLRLRGLLERAL